MPQPLFALAIALALPFSFAAAQQPAAPSGPGPTAEAIMARVAVNQDQSEAERAHYVYVQHARTSSRKGKTIMCEEITDSRVTPSGAESHQELLKLDGRLLVKHKYVTYTHLPPAKNGDKSSVEADHDDISISVGDDDSDRDLVETMRNHFVNDKSKDGIGKGLFPLTSKNQQDYQFKLLGHEPRNGHDCFHIEFHPKDKDDFGWKGDAYIDSATYQPVFIRTAMARNIPFAVRTMLGTNVPGLGFTVIYAPQPDGVWFPVSFGTEFKVHVLFFVFNREIVIDAQNRDFEKTHVSSKIIGGGDVVEPPQKPE
jgi:hypothetical protein